MRSNTIQGGAHALPTAAEFLLTPLALRHLQHGAEQARTAQTPARDASRGRYPPQRADCVRVQPSGCPAWPHGTPARGSSDCDHATLSLCLALAQYDHPGLRAGRAHDYGTRHALYRHRAAGDTDRGWRDLSRSSDPYLPHATAKSDGGYAPNLGIARGSSAPGPV